MILRKAVLAAIVALTVAGCASSGTKMSQSELQALEPGTTTLSDMKQSFGSPISQTYDTQGNLVVNWAYTHVGYMGIGNEQQSVSAIFDEDKVLEQVNVMEGDGPGARLGH